MLMNLIKKIKYMIVFCLVFVITLEFGCYLLSKLKYLPFNDYPLVYLKSGESVGLDWRNEKSEWGAWHKINMVDKHVSSCINAEYKSNNIGGRDDDFHIELGGDYVLLGDSFAEGYGVNKVESAETVLESILKKSIMNFGSAGNFGPLQYYLVYSRLAKKYPHKGVIIFLLPANDFIDNDYRFWKGRDIIDAEGHKRYRPYWISDKNGGFDWFYPAGAVKTDCYNCPPPTFRAFLIKFSWIGNLYRSVESVYNSKKTAKKNINDLAVDEVPYSLKYAGYFDSQEIQQRASMFFLEKIIAESEGRSVNLIVIPDKNDIARIHRQEDYKSQYWYQKLIKMSLVHQNFSFFDLAKVSIEDHDKLFLECDGHWSSVGNRWAAEKISENLKKLY